VRVLRELYGIDPGSVIAVGDASNDLPMFEAAGLAVAMGDGMPEAVAAADRVLSDNDGAAIAELVAELFPA
jgi:hydroxymethylpyrimidine pyrophosphatase-like HAD family hydrolase